MRNLREVDAEQGAAFQQRQIERQRGNGARGKADHEMASAPGDRPKSLHRDLASDGIEDHVGAVSVGQLLERVAPAGLRVVDDGVGAVLFRELALLRCRRRRDDAGAEQLADLDSRGPGAAGRAQHQKLLACDDHGACTQRIERSEIIGAKRGGDFGRDAVRQRVECVRLDDDLLGKRARPRHAHHTHAGSIASRLARGFFHNSGELRAGNEGQGILGLIEPLNLQTVDKADSRSFHPDAQLSGLHARRRNVH